MNTPYEKTNEQASKIFSCHKCGEKSETVLCKECADKLLKSESEGK